MVITPTVTSRVVRVQVTATPLQSTCHWKGPTISDSAEGIIFFKNIWMNLKKSSLYVNHFVQWKATISLKIPCWKREKTFSSLWRTLSVNVLDKSSGHLPVILSMTAAETIKCKFRDSSQQVAPLWTAICGRPFGPIEL